MTYRELLIKTILDTQIYERHSREELEQKPLWILESIAYHLR